ncbi:MAG: hypothetical protein AAFU41_01860 [Pseudomonadota bacterium]
MLISHRHHFIIFPDPLESCHWIRRALAPWVDQSVASRQESKGKTAFFDGMTPSEVAAAFARDGRDFDAYARIAIVQNPYLRMAQLYDKISDQDPVWRFKERLGVPKPLFDDWLQSTRPSGNGAGNALSPRWRRHAAWSADEWCDGRIDHVIRAENAMTDLQRVFRKLGIAPAFRCRSTDQHELQKRTIDRYASRSIATMRKRYRSDLNMLSDHA